MSPAYLVDNFLKCGKVPSLSAKEKYSFFNMFKVALIFHIVFGSLALVIAPLAMITTKGGLWHRRWGKIYFWAMTGVALTATILCWLGSGLFLFLVAIFSFYLAFTGYKVLRRKKPEARPDIFDWSAAGAMLLAGLALVLQGCLSTHGQMRAVPILFGLIGLALSATDIKSFLRPSKDPRAWFYAHMTRFLAAYIATVSAFSVVNFQFLPGLWRWTWPTIVGVVGISFWRRHYVRKFQRQSAKAPAAG